jgi:hypothetical protein
LSPADDQLGRDLGDDVGDDAAVLLKAVDGVHRYNL